VSGLEAVNAKEYWFNIYQVSPLFTFQGIPCITKDSAITASVFIGCKTLYRIHVRLK